MTETPTEPPTPKITVDITCADPEVILATLADHGEVQDFELRDANNTAEDFFGKTPA